MAQQPMPPFLAGVIEGFYGKPWTPLERAELFRWMREAGLNTYLYAPKDDVRHRALWREQYAETEVLALGEVVRQCQDHGLHFVYALGPGLDIRYADGAEVDCLVKRFEQLSWLGCNHWALLFDDIPDQLEAEATQRWGSLAAAQAQVANRVYAWAREQSAESRFLFCPTPYCGRMAAAGLGGPGYLGRLGESLDPGIDIFWTGPEIISGEVTVEHLREVEGWLRRKPVLWDNLFANDYDGRRFFCGPYAGRPLELKRRVGGLLLNPNSELPLNFVPVRSFGDYLGSTGSWDPRRSYEDALAAWGERFQLLDGRVATEDLELFGDCYYLPYSEGARAEALYREIASALAGGGAAAGDGLVRVRQGVTRLRDTCARLAGLRDRELFYALSRRIWELREEMDLLDKVLAAQGSGGPARSDFHLPGTYRGGMVARLQRLLEQQADGTFRLVRRPEGGCGDGKGGTQ